MAKTTTIPLFRTVLLLIALLCTSSHIQAQFYTGMHQPFGKNRVQHEDFYWTFYRFNNFNIYQTSGGEKLSEYTARHAPQIIANIERKIGYTSAQHINFIIYNKKNEFKQSNVGYDDPMKGTGGVTQIASSNVFLYFEGDYNDFHEQIEKGVADMLIHRMIFGDNWKEVIKNATLLYVPDWYTKGLISYIAQPWSTELDDRVKDGVMTNRFKKFNHLEEPDKTYAGHAIWAYVAEVYGPEMIPNVLYMTRVSRSIESGFLFVLGVGLKQLASDAWLHYRVKYELDEENMKFPEDKLLYSKTRKKRDYYQITMSEDGRYFAFASNRLGKHKAYLYDTEKKKKKKLYKGGQKMDRLTDLSVPVLDFREDNGVVAVFYEKKAEPHLIFYDIEEKKKYKREVFRVDKVLSAKFSPDGGKMIMSAMFQGQTDLWEYNLRGNTVKQLTNDMYDDLDPDYINENEIIFVSNRPNDTLEKTRGYLPDLMTKKDIYVLNTNSKSLQRITETPFINESSPAKYKDKQYVYLSDRNGIRNRWIARMDSAISHVDTVIHYRSITNTSPLTNYSRNIIEHSVTPDIDKATDLIFEDGKYRIYQFGIEELEDQSKHEMKETDYSLTKKKKRDKDKENPVELQKVEVAVRILKPDTTKLEEDPNRINIDDYTFQGEDRMSEQRRGSIGQFATIAGKGSESETDTIKKDEFSMPERRDYSLNFSYTDITSTMDFNFANSLYQPFNGGPYTNPGIGVLMKVDMLDLFQDYKIQGGFRYGFNNSNLEFFLSLFDRSRRLDRRYTLKRQSFRLNTPTSVQKVVIYKGEYGLSYPFSEALALRGELSYRNDRTTAASVDDQSLVEPDDFLSQGGLKLELVFDNTRKRGLNLYYGTRFKIFGETYLETNNLQSDLNVVGIDFRHYQKISRDFIYAGRLAASSSFGSRKVVYYLGSVDDWIILDPSKARFNRQTPISQQQNYQFQALASPMRGFIQNARNGNSFFVINNEFRFPIFRYFSTRPQKSDILENFQIVAFSDVGTAWNGTSPFSDENEFNTITVVDGPVTVKLDNKRYPIIGSAGAGLRTKLLGYFLKLDLAWGIDDGIVQQPITHISMGFDF